jgi:hypothetical protein
MQDWKLSRDNAQSFDSELRVPLERNHRPPTLPTDLNRDKEPEGLWYKMYDWKDDGRLKMNTNVRFSQFLAFVHALYPRQKVQTVDNCLLWYTIGDSSKKRSVAMSTSNDYVKFLERVADDGKCCMCFFRPVSPSIFVQCIIYWQCIKSAQEDELSPQPSPREDRLLRDISVEAVSCAYIPVYLPLLV